MEKQANREFARIGGTLQRATDDTADLTKAYLKGDLSPFQYSNLCRQKVGDTLLLESLFNGFIQLKSSFGMGRAKKP